MSRILVIDDKQDNLVAASAMLKDHIADSTFLLARSGAEGLEKAKTEAPDVILLDIQISDIDAYEMCRYLKENSETSHIPIILMTAETAVAEERARGLEMGADAFLSKPINRSELIAQVRVAIRVKKAEDQLRIDKYLLEKIIMDRTKALEYSRKELAIKLQKEAEEKELHRAESRRLRQQKAEAIKTLTKGISHDFNDILAAIMGFAELAEMSMPDGPAKGHLKEVISSGQRAKELIRQLSAISHAEKGDLKAVKLVPIIAETLRTLKASFPSNIEIRHQISEIPDTVMADGEQLRHVLNLICDNAYEAMRAKGGTLEIAFSDIQIEDPELSEYSDIRPGNYLKISVRDTGIGIAPELIECIFDPYFTTKARYEGSGLGLAVAQGIIRRFDGTIRAASRVGKGSVFEILLPRIEENVQEKQVSDSKPLPKGNERILVVDDEKVVLQLVQQMLYRLGYDAVISSNPYEALEIFRKNPKSFDLIITDLKMPHLSGKGLAKEIRAIRREIPIILCTGNDEKIPSSLEESGIKEVVSKPFSMRDIAYAIRRALETQ